MLRYNRGVSFYCKGKLSAGDSSLKSQFWTGEWILLKSKECHKFCLLFLLKCKMCLHPAYPADTMEVDMSGHWATFQSKLCCWKCSFPWGTGETTTITCLFMFSGGSWVPLAMGVLLVVWNPCEWQSMSPCWIPPFSIWTWNLFAILQGCFLAFLFQWCKSCLLLPSP